MEDDIKHVSFNLGASGSYAATNLTFGPLTPIFTTSTGSLFNRSGKLVDLTIVMQTSSNAVDLDLLFFPSGANVISGAGQQFTMSYDHMKTCVGRVRVEDTDFKLMSNMAVASLYNLNTTFQSRDLYLATVYQDGATKVFQTGSAHITIGYVLGQNN